VIFAVLLLAGVSAAVWLGIGAGRCWLDQRAGLAYELTPSYLGTALRGVAAVAALGCALTAGLLLLTDAHHPAAPAARHRPVASDARPRRTPSSPRPTASPAPSASPASPGSPSGGMLTVGHPSGGELRAGTLPGYPGRLRVWLPPQYPHRSRPFPVLVVLADPAVLPDVYAGLVGAVTGGRSNPFVVVAPPAGQAVDGDRLRGAVARGFRVEPAPHAWGVLGVDADAPAAVAAELADPGAYVAAAGVGGRYDALRPVPRPGVQLLLADTAQDRAGQASAARLRRALTGLPQAAVRLSDAVDDFTAEREQLRLIRVAAGYLTECMASAAHA
jgi:hypothetical protein